MSQLDLRLDQKQIVIKMSICVYILFSPISEFGIFHKISIEATHQNISSVELIQNFRIRICSKQS